MSAGFLYHSAGCLWELAREGFIKWSWHRGMTASGIMAEWADSHEHCFCLQSLLRIFNMHKETTTLSWTLRRFPSDVDLPEFLNVHICNCMSARMDQSQDSLLSQVSMSESFWLVLRFTPLSFSQSVFESINHFREDPELVVLHFCSADQCLNQ